MTGRSLIALLLGIALPISADTLEGKVTRALDGEILVVKKGKLTQAVRLLGVDAPDKGQPYYHEARKSLSKLAKKKWVTVEWYRRDDECKAKQPAECPLLGRVLFDGTDINLEQLKRGFGWHHQAHLREQSTPDRTQYMEAEEKARQKRLGLWRQKKPMAPWEFRRLLSSVSRGQ